MGTLPNSKFLNTAQPDFRNALLFSNISKVSKDLGGIPKRRGGVRGGEARVGEPRSPYL